MRRWPFAWTHTRRLVGWMPSAGSAVAVMIGFALGASVTGYGDVSPGVRVAEVIAPLVFGLQAAFLFSPDGEPPLELLLTCPLTWIVFERWLVLIGLQGGLTLACNLIAQVLPNIAEGLSIAITRWLAPCLFIGGVAILTTLLTRQGVMGALLATLLWYGMLLGGDALIVRWPFLWLVHVYLQPQSVLHTVYALNRAGLMLAGLALTAMAARLTCDEERMLGVRPRVKR